MKYQRGTARLGAQSLQENIGTCGALTCGWIRNMLSKTSVDLTKPDQRRAALIDGASWIRQGGDVSRVLAIMEECELKQMKFHTFRSVMDFLKYVRDHFGFYVAELSEGHFIGAANLTMKAASPRYYLYDSNQALFESTHPTDFYRTGSMKLGSPHMVGAHSNQWNLLQTVWVSEVEGA